MADHIKVHYETVQDSVSNVESALGSMDHTLPQGLASGNVLDLVEKLNQLNEVLQQQGEEYQRILKMNNDSVRTALQTLEETDQQLSASINVR